jgi:hypothetical protein
LSRERTELRRIAEKAKNPQWVVTAIKEEDYQRAAIDILM